jgi:hypothetical protein
MRPASTGDRGMAKSALHRTVDTLWAWMVVPCQGDAITILPDALENNQGGSASNAIFGCKGRELTIEQLTYPDVPRHPNPRCSRGLRPAHPQPADCDDLGNPPKHLGSVVDWSIVDW